MASKKSFLSRLSSKQKLSLFFFAVLLLAFPLIVLAAKFQQDFRSRAYTPSPIITTSSLPPAKQGVKYEATVLGIDSSGYGKFLSMNFSGLPTGLSKGPCQISVPTTAKIRPSTTPTPPISVSPTPARMPPISITPTPTPIMPTQISCLISGTPTTPGTFKVIVTLSNSQTKLSATQGLGLSVTPSPTTCIMCPPPPVNCTYVGGSCSSCGALSCEVTRTPTPTTRFYTPTPIIYRP